MIAAKLFRRAGHACLPQLDQLATVSDHGEKEGSDENMGASIIGHRCTINVREGYAQTLSGK